MPTIPKSMKALIANTPAPPSTLADPALLEQHLKVLDVDVPKPAHGEVLIKVSRGTINPNDLYHLEGIYTATRGEPFPRPMGFEGAGIVVASGGGLIGRFRVGSPVAFYAAGMFAEYVICNALDLIDIPGNVDFSTAACSVANPMTALTMLKVARNAGAKTIINTAGASALGRLLIRLGKTQGIKVIPIVRRNEQINLCKQEGATEVLNSSSDNFDEALAAACTQNGCHLAFDCVAGDMPQRLLEALPEDKGTVKLYGYMTPGPIQLMPQSLFTERRLETFEINAELSRMSLLSKGLVALSIRRGMGNTLRSDVQKSFPLSEGVSAFSWYSQNMTGGKVQIVADETL
ncbi:MAG: zinc-binding dehydrogenase [Pseudomonadales bacterium]|nr:zinc-binding dehydrogenase [Pseudomonadales bacterium]